MQLRRIHPDGALVSPEQALAELRLTGRALPDRPYVVANFVVTLDGRAAVGGKSGPIGGQADRAVFHALRSEVDAVLAGTGTLAAERYGRIVPDAEARSRRERSGLAGEPLAVVITRSGTVPWDIPLFAESAQRAWVISGEPVEPPADVAAKTTVVLAEREADVLATALGRLRTELGIRTLLCEGGPTMLSALVARGALDELFLTVAPLLAGGGVAPTITRGPEPPQPAEMQLAWALEHEGELLLRYVARR